MRALRTLGGIAVLVAALGACVPGVVPREVAFESSDAVLGVGAGETVDLIVRYDYAEFGLEPGDLEPLEFLPDVFEPARRSVTGRFTLRPAGLPAGWHARRLRVERVLEPLGDEAFPGAGGVRGDLYSLEAIFRLTAPPSAGGGVDTARLVLRAFNGVEVARVVRLRVVPSEKSATP